MIVEMINLVITIYIYIYICICIKIYMVLMFSPKCVAHDN